MISIIIQRPLSPREVANIVSYRVSKIVFKMVSYIVSNIVPIRYLTQF